MKFKNISIFTLVIFSCLITGCDSDIYEKIKSKFSLTQEEEMLEKAQSEINKNDCNDEENKQLVLEMIQEEFTKQTNLSKDKFFIEPTYTMLSTEEKTDLKTVCNARIIYTYPKEIQNKSSVKLDVEYMITKNELIDKGYIVTLFKTSLNDIIDFQENYNNKKEDYLFEKLQIKKINQTSTSKLNDGVLFSVLQDSLKLNDWNEDSKNSTCRHDNSNELTQCGYKFTKKTYEVTVITKRQDECFFCSKKPEYVSTTHINELKN